MLEYYVVQETNIVHAIGSYFVELLWKKDMVGMKH